nr:MAG TPA: hypothetical protein [Caudoviricetes sp.]
MGEFWENITKTLDLQGFLLCIYANCRQIRHIKMIKNSLKSLLPR